MGWVRLEGEKNKKAVLSFPKEVRPSPPSPKALRARVTNCDPLTGIVAVGYQQRPLTAELSGEAGLLGIYGSPIAVHRRKWGQAPVNMSL
jgi:hypothetical protein